MEEIQRIEDYNKLVEQWTHWMRIELRASMRKYNIREKTLYDSFNFDFMKGSDGRISEVVLNFKYYGRFVDMGVGRGRPLGTDYSEAKIRNRAIGVKSSFTRKAWYSKTFSHNMYRLSELMGTEFGETGVTFIEEVINNQPIVIKL